MLAIIPARRSTLLRARWRDAMSQTRRDLSTLQRGIARFANRRPVAVALFGLSAAFLMFRAVGGRR
jgi:hypothetical protein